MKKYNGAVFFDFDGTLVDEKEHIYIPTDETKRQRIYDLHSHRARTLLHSENGH